MELFNNTGGFAGLKFGKHSFEVTLMRYTEIPDDCREDQQLNIRKTQKKAMWVFTEAPGEVDDFQGWEAINWSHKSTEIIWYENKNVARVGKY